MDKHVQLLESTTSVSKESGSKGVYRVKLIEADVQGSSGYYPAEVLERDGARAFPAGTHVYLDHPSESEEWDRPERSVKDLAAYLLDEGTFEPKAVEGPGLYSRIQVLPQHREFVEEAKDIVGMSIRALGIREYSQEMDRDEVTALVRGESVDIVTRAGAGGRILEMTESARNAGNAAPQQLFAELKESDKAGMQKVYEAVSALAPLVESLTNKVTELEEKAAAAEKKREEDATLSFGEIVGKLDAANLPAVSRKFLADTYAPGVDLDAAIKDEQSRVEAIKSELGGGETKPEDKGEVAESTRGVGQVKVAESGDNYTTANNLITGIFG